MRLWKVSSKDEVSIQDIFFLMFPYKTYILVPNVMKITNQGRVFQSIVSLKSSLRGQLVKWFTTLLPKKLIIFVENMREACTAKASTFLQQKILAYFRY